MTRRFENWAALGLILLICTLSFGVYLNRLGFYWDDYASIFVYLKHGQGIFKEWFGEQARPLGGYLSGLIWSTFGVDPLPWQVINFALYVLSVILFWRILRLLFPAYPALMTLIALLFAVYPSYHLRPIPIAFSLIASLVIFLFSFWSSLLAVKRRNFLLILLAAVLIPLYQLIYEQNIAYEALRPLAIAYLLLGNDLFAVEKWRKEWRLLLSYCLPALLVAAGLVFWRFFIFQPSGTYETYNEPIYTHSLSGLLLTFKLSLAAPIRMLTFDWVHMPYRVFVTDGVDIDAPALLAFVGLIGCLVYLWRCAEDRQPRGAIALVVFLLGLPLMGVLLLSVHLVGRVLEDGVNSRWALTPSLLAALILGLTIPRLLRSAALGHLALVILIVVGLGVQAGINQEYSHDWSLRRELWWQVKWRAPQVRPDTFFAFVIAPDDFAFDRPFNDYEITPQTNFFYTGTAYPSVTAGDPNLIANLFYNSRPLAGNWSQALSDKQVIFRDWEFDVNHLLLFAYEGGCLQTADPAFALQMTPNATFASLVPYHHPEQITVDPLSQAGVGDFPEMTDPEPPHEWCFYFQQVQWANQMGRLDEAVRLADEGGAFSPAEGHSIEWIPFIEAYDRVGRFADAEKLVYRIAFGDAFAGQVLCEHLSVLATDAGDPEPIRQQMDLIPSCQLVN